MRPWSVSRYCASVCLWVSKNYKPIKISGLHTHTHTHTHTQRHTHTHTRAHTHTQTHTNTHTHKHTHTNTHTHAHTHTHRDSNARRPEFEEGMSTIKPEIVVGLAIRQCSDHSYLLIFVVLFRISHLLI